MGTYRTVEIPSRRDVKDSATHGEVDGGAVDAVERE
jgi:hypothetical protein